MNEFFTMVNQIVLHSVCYAFFFLIYGYAIYNVGKFIVRLLTSAFRCIKAYWNAWCNSKNQ